MRIGDRVSFKDGKRSCRGTIVKVYPGYTFHDPDEDEEIRIPTHCAVKVDSIPRWWPYCDTDVFAPEKSKLRVL